MQHEKWKNVIILGALRPPSPLGSMLDPVIMIEFMHLSALKFSTLTRGGGGWRPFLHLHVKWCFDDVLIFRCVPLLENDQNKIWYGELFYPKSHTLAGSVSELSHTTDKSMKSADKSMKSAHFLIEILTISAPFWHCRVTRYSGENLNLFPHTLETRSSRKIA